MSFKVEDDDYYCVFLFQRKKDNPELRKSTVCVFQDLVKLKHIKKKIPIYRSMAEHYGARVYVSASPRDLRRAREDLIIRMVKTHDTNSEPANLQAQLFSSLMRFPISGKKKFVIDVDTKEEQTFCEVRTALSSVDVIWSACVVVETKHGYHIISDPFDVRCLEGVDFVEVKRDGMTDISYLEEVI